MEQNFRQFKRYITRRVGRTKRQLNSFFSKKRNQRHSLLAGLVIVSFVLLIGLAISLSHSSEQDKYYSKQRAGWVKQRQSLNNSLKSVQKQKADTQAALKQKADSEAALKAQIDELNKQLQAKKERQLAAAEAVSVPAPIAAIPQPAIQPQAPVSGCGDNFYANYIYMHESGCRTTAMNPSGCYGIGQACPASKIAQCGADYACQNAWFTNYANSAYGGWAGAYSFWISHSWW